MLIVLFFTPVFFVASVLPYRLWDSLSFGSWSRLIGETGRFSSTDLDLFLNRPLFYATQGYTWRVLGYHEWLGRWLSALFGLLFCLCLWVLARRFARDRDTRQIVAAVAVGAAVASSVLATYVAAGMTDVPVGAAAAATAVALWSSWPRPWRLPLVAVAAAATVLAKPTGLFALAGLVLASLIVLRERDSRTRTIEGLAAVGVGAVAALVYDLVQASRLNLSLLDFLRAGNTDYYLSRGSSERIDAVLRADWLGAGLRLPVLFGLIFAVAMAVGGRSTVALRVAVPVALVWSIAGPLAADGGTPHPFGEISLDLAAYLIVAAALLAALFLVRAEPFGREKYAMLLLWLAPPTIAWLLYRTDEVRFLSPAWPAFFLITAAGLTVVSLALRRVAPAAALAPAAAVVLLAFANVPSIDGLGRTGWRDLLELGPSGWGNKAAVENFAYGPFSYELDLARTHVGPDERIVSSDGRLKYFFPGRVEEFYATSCADLRRGRFFALLTSGESADIMTRLHGSSVDPLAWLQCRNPRVTSVGEQAGTYAVFVVGAPPAQPSPPEACRISTSAGQMFDAVFWNGVSYAQAKEMRVRAEEVGFQGLKIERTGCDSFRVVLSGVPSLDSDIRREAASVGFRIAIVPAVRYPEVPPDVPPMRP